MLGDKWKTFSLSYLELLIKSLSATTEVKMAELSYGQMLSVISNYRKMHYEMEYLFRKRNEELHEFYVHYFLTYTALFKPQSTKVVTEVQVFMFNGPFYTINTLAFDIDFLRKYNVHPEKDLICFDNQMYLKKTTNLSRVNDRWRQMVSKIPGERVRRVYYDDGMDLAYNIKLLETLIQGFHKQTSKDAKEWSRKVLENICLAFELVESLVAYEGHQFGMFKLRKKLREVLLMYDKGIFCA